MNNIGITIK